MYCMYSYYYIILYIRTVENYKYCIVAFFHCVYQGTGKSVTGAHLAYGFVHKNRSKGLTTRDGRVKCVLVCGPSNKSVDVVLGM